MCSVPGTPAVPGENLWEHILRNTGTPVFSRVFGICSYVPEKSHILIKHKNQLVVSSLNAYLRVYRFFWLLGTGLPFTDSLRSQNEGLSCWNYAVDWHPIFASLCLFPIAVPNKSSVKYTCLVTEPVPYRYLRVQTDRNARTPVFSWPFGTCSYVPKKSVIN